MKILVCGNLGYIGPTLCKHLKSNFKKSTIVGLDTGFFSSCITTTERLGDTYCDNQIYMDIRDVDLDFYSKFDSIVLLSAISNDPMGKKFEKITDQINHIATIKIIENYLKLPNKNVIFASSCSVYGAGGNKAKTEIDTINPLTAYARSKIAVEKVLQDVDYGINSIATSLRFATACGMSDRLRLDLVLNDFVASAILNKKIVVLSDGSPWRPLININDMARAIEWAIIRKKFQNDSYIAVNVGSKNWNFTVRQLAESVASHVDEASLNIDPAAQPDKRSYKVNFDLFKKIAPDHQPVFSLDDTIVELRRGINKIKNFIGSDFRSSRFIRLNSLEDNLRSKILSSELRWINKL